MKEGKCKSKHCSALSKDAWCDLNAKCGALILHDMCPNPSQASEKVNEQMVFCNLQD